MCQIIHCNLLRNTHSYSRLSVLIADQRVPPLLYLVCVRVFVCVELLMRTYIHVHAHISYSSRVRVCVSLCTFSETYMNTLTLHVFRACACISVCVCISKHTYKHTRTRFLPLYSASTTVHFVSCEVVTFLMQLAFIKVISGSSWVSGCLWNGLLNWQASLPPSLRSSARL